MLITCPNCSSQYEKTDEAQEKQAVRCERCGVYFWLSPQPLTPAPPIAAQTQTTTSKQGSGVIKFTFIAAMIFLGLPVMCVMLTQPRVDHDASRPSTSLPPTPSSGGINRNLGSQAYYFGSQSQAAELLRIMSESPGASKYSITYSTPVDTVVFGCDFSADSIGRIHQRPNGHGTQEIWKGHIRHRLQSAAKGGSLNDTPAGSTPGSFSSF